MMKLSLEIRKIGMVAAVVAVTGFLGAVASISAGWGIPGVIISVVLTLILLVLGYMVIRPVLVKNWRGLTILQAITDIGLEDIENRDDRDHVLPPVKYYESAKAQVVITGISAFRTFDQHLDILKEILEAGIELYILILHTKSTDVGRLSIREGLNIAGQIDSVIYIIETNKLKDYSWFHIRFMHNLPPFTAVMVDGDISPTGGTPRDNDGRIRVQPATVHGTQHSGTILQFRKKSSKPAGAFEFFSEDLRNQWKEGSEDPRKLHN